MSQFSATKASQMVGVISKLLPWQSFSNTCELSRDASAQIARRKGTFCSKWHPGSLEAQSRHWSGQDQEEQGYSWATTRRSLSPWCRKNPKTRGLCVIGFYWSHWDASTGGGFDWPAELSSHSHLNDGPGNLTEILHLFFILLPLLPGSKHAEV